MLAHGGERFVPAAARAHDFDVGIQRLWAHGRILRHRRLRDAYPKRGVTKVISKKRKLYELDHVRQFGRYPERPYLGIHRAGQWSRGVAGRSVSRELYVQRC